jgi:hypothetical protein
MATYLPFSDVVAAYGYRQPDQVRNRSNLLLLAVAYVVMGSALGTVAGTSLAMASFQTGIPTLVFRVVPPVQADATVASVARPPAQPATFASNVVAAPASAPAAAPLKLASASVAKTSVAKASVTVVHLHRNGPIRSAVSKQIATQSQVATTLPAPAATVESGAKSYTFISEGDATVADFNAAMGTIETYEGKTFMIGTTAAALATGSLQDSGLSIHYRCDQGGTCTLTQAGQIMQNVRLM